MPESSQPANALSPSPTIIPPALVTPPCPDQEVFSSEEKAFLRSHLDAYCTLPAGNGTQGMKGVKGNKREWVMDMVYSLFINKFKLDGPNGPNLGSLQTVHHSIIHNLPQLRCWLCRKWCAGLAITNRVLPNHPSLPSQTHSSHHAPKIGSNLLLKTTLKH